MTRMFWSIADLLISLDHCHRLAADAKLRSATNAVISFGEASVQDARVQYVKKRALTSKGKPAIVHNGGIARARRRKETYGLADYLPFQIGSELLPLRVPTLRESAV